MFLTSPRKHVAAHLSVFDQLKCRTLLSPEPQPASVTSILATHELRFEPIPAFEYFLERSHPPFPY